MKFKDYKAKKDEYENWCSERLQEEEPRRQAYRTLLLEHRREWDLGVTSYVHVTSENRVVVRCDGASNYEFTLWLKDPEAGARYQVGMSVHLLALSSKQWRLFADVVAVVERWRDGDIDDLPPSGVWPGAEGAS